MTATFDPAAVNASGSSLAIPAPASDSTRTVQLVLLLGLVPSLWTAWILWLAPIEGLTADRAAMAARDFTALWTAGRLAGERAFHVLSDPAGFTAYLRALFGPGMPSQIWPYPPIILLLARPLAAWPLLPGFWVYTALTAAALATALRLIRFSPLMIAAVLLSPAVACNALTGQNGALTATVLVAGLALVERRPLIAGLLLGVLCLKPQLALLLPVCLIAGRHTRAIIGGCVSSCSLALSSIAVFGYEPWVAFFTRNRTSVAEYADAPWQSEPAQTFFSSVFMAARSAGAGLTASYLLQGAVTLGCACVAWWLWRNPGVNGQRRLAATIALVLLGAPWVHIYDLPALAASIVLLLPGSRGSERLLLGFAWLWPAFSGLVPIAPLVSMLSVGSVAWMAASRSHPAALEESASH